MSGDPPSPSTDPFRLVGSLFERKYLVDRLVARGGFGVVYAGRHLDLDVPVAIKVLKPCGEFDPDVWDDLLGHFVDEAKTLARLRHPNIVAVLDAGVAPVEGFDSDVPWMALEWLEGETLRDALVARRGKGGRTPVECMDLLRPVLEAIADAHDAGIVHRDLKPSNIMLVPRRRGVEARVLDFGIAKMMTPELAHDPSSGNTATESRTSSFSVSSAAPEQLSGARTGPWTDVYALALLLTELLTDRAPVGRDDPNEHYRKVFDEVRPTPRRLGVDVGAWEDVLARALAVRPSARPPNARALLAELDAALANGAVHVPLAGAEALPEERSSSSGFPATRTGNTGTRRSSPRWLALAGMSAPVALVLGATYLLSVRPVASVGSVSAQVEPMVSSASAALSASVEPSAVAAMSAAPAVAPALAGPSVIAKIVAPPPSTRSSPRVALSSSAPREPVLPPAATSAPMATAPSTAPGGILPVSPY